MRSGSGSNVHMVVVVLATFVVAGLAAAGPDLEIASRENANPSLASDGRFVVLAWGATTSGATDVYAATSRDGGRTFGEPTRVNHTAGQATIGGEQPPRVALVPRQGREPAVVVVWTAKGPAGTRLLSARSDDGARSFGRATSVPGSDGAGNRGWQSIATNRDGQVVAVWLDHRELAPAAATSTATHEHTTHGSSDASPEDGVARAQRSRLLFSRLDEAGDARALTGGVCYCCKTSLAVGSDGSIAAVWRHVYPGQMRDIAFTMSRDGGRTFVPPVRVSEDGWRLDGCPENGPAVAVDDRGVVHVVWPTLIPGARPGSEGTPALFYARSGDGRQFTPRRRLPTEGAPRHPQIALGTKGELIVTWDEGANGVRRAVLGRGVTDDGGAVRFTRRIVSGADAATYPVVTRADGGFVLAWTHGPSGRTAIRTQRIDD